MSVPPFSVAFVGMSCSRYSRSIIKHTHFAVSMIAAFISDRYQCRGAITVFCSVLCTIGFAMFLGSANHHVQYGSLFLSIPGTYAMSPALSTWNANNSAPHARRATAIALGFIMTNSGGILATWLLGSLSPPPRYARATKILIIFSVLTGFFTTLNIFYLSHQNKKKAEVRGRTARHEEAARLGDKSAWFVYSL